MEEADASSILWSPPSAPPHHPQAPPLLTQYRSGERQEGAWGSEKKTAHKVGLVSRGVKQAENTEKRGCGTWGHTGYMSCHIASGSCHQILIQRKLETPIFLPDLKNTMQPKLNMSLSSFQPQTVACTPAEASPCLRPEVSQKTSHTARNTHCQAKGL